MLALGTVRALHWQKLQLVCGLLEAAPKCVLEPLAFAYQNSGPIRVSAESGPGSGGQVGCSWSCVDALESHLDPGNSSFRNLRSSTSHNGPGPHPSFLCEACVSPGLGSG